LSSFSSASVILAIRYWGDDTLNFSSSMPDYLSGRIFVRSSARDGGISCGKRAGKSLLATFRERKVRLYRPRGRIVAPGVYSPFKFEPWIFFRRDVLFLPRDRFAAERARARYYF
jgi:hypothetical protein